MTEIFHCIKIGRNILSEMAKADINVDDLAVTLNSDTQYIKSILLGEQLPTAIELVKIADAVRIDPMALCKDSWDAYDCLGYIDLETFAKVATYFIDVAKAEESLHKMDTAGCPTNKEKHGTL